MFLPVLTGWNVASAQEGQHHYQPIFLTASPFYTLSGRVFQDGFQTDSINVYIYREQVQGTVELVDSTFSVGKNGSYSFSGMVGGTYYLKAVKTGNRGASIETYYGESPVWITSKAIILRKDMSDRNIDLLIEGTASGMGQVSGTVTYGSTEINFPTGSGAEGVPVLLLNDGYVMRRTVANSNGFYTFDNVPLSSYTVVVDFPGKSMAPYAIRMNSSKQMVDDINFVIEKSTITTPYVAGVDDIQNLQEASIYPNPFRSTVSLRGFEKTIEYRLLDLTGKLRQSGEMNPPQYLDLSALEAGVYFLIMTHDGSNLVQRIIKED